MLAVSLEPNTPIPVFKKIEDVRFGLKTVSCLVQPILDSNEEV